MAGQTWGAIILDMVTFGIVFVGGVGVACLAYVWVEGLIARRHKRRKAPTPDEGRGA